MLNQFGPSVYDRTQYPAGLVTSVIQYEEALLNVFEETDATRALYDQCVADFGLQAVLRYEYVDFTDVWSALKNVVTLETIRAVARHSFMRKYYTRTDQTLKTQIEAQERIMEFNAINHI